MKLSARITVATAVLVTAAAAATSVGAQAIKIKDTAAVHVLKPSADLIVQEQLQARTFPNAYLAIEALHSNWLRARNLNPVSGSVINPASGSSGSSSSSTSTTSQGLPREAAGIQVYIDGVRAGGLEALKSIPIASVFSMRRISGTAAQARFGIGHSDGVIFVATGPDKGGH